VKVLETKLTVIAASLVLLFALTAAAQVNGNRGADRAAAPIAKPVTVTLVRWPYT
jgi:hypothetical protein